MSVMKLSDLYKKPMWLYALVSLVSALLMLAASALWRAPLQGWEERLASRTWSLANQDATERRVVVVDIDEKSTQALGPWPWPRDRVASLLTGLDAYGVNLKVVDVLFDGAQEGAQDQKLALALQSGAPTVISQLFALRSEAKTSVPQSQIRSGTLSGAAFGCTHQGSHHGTQLVANGFMAPDALFAGASAGVGHITPVVDPDGSIRRVPAVVCFEGQAYPALTVEALSAATGAKPTLQTRQDIGALGFMGTLGATFSSQSAQTLDVGGLQLPLDHQGQLRVSYQMPRLGFASVSAVDVLQGKVPPSLLKGAWALVSSTAFGGGDAVPTPQGGAVGGVEVHAQILSAALDGRTPLTPAWAPLWSPLAGLLAVLVLVGVLRASGPKAAWALPLTAVALVALIFAAHAWLLLLNHQWLGWGQPAVFVALLAAALLGSEMLRVRAERERLYGNLSSYLPEGAARKVAFEAPNAQVVAETREATVMMVDLRNFSAYCEEKAPEDAAMVLHLFYTTVERIVSQHGGVVEQMVGDGLTAVWNGSNPCQDHAKQALEAAGQIWKEGVAQLPRVASRKTPALDIGVGIETGPVMVGSFGPAHRRVHTVMGEAVSVASRLEKLTSELGYPVLLGPKAFAQSQAQLQLQLQSLVSQNDLGGQTKPEIQKLGEFLLMGMRTPRTVYALKVQVDPSHLHLVSGMDAGYGPEVSMIG